MNKDKKLQITVFVLLCMLLIVFIIKLCPVALQNDILYDIKLGGRYLSTGIFRVDDYSFHLGLIYQTQHFLVCIIDYLVYSVFSFRGLYCLEVILLSIISLLFYKLNKQMLTNKFLIYILLFFELIALSPFISLRAQMYSYIIFMVEILIIERYLDTNDIKYAFIIGILPLLLINFHSGVIYFYFLIILSYLLNIFVIRFKRFTNDKRVGKHQLLVLSFSMLIGAFLTLVNPYGINALTYGFKTITSHEISGYISEFQPPQLLSSMGLLISLYIITCLVSLILSHKRIKVHELLILFGTIFMTLTSTRHFSLLVITSPIILPHIEDAYGRIDKSNWSLTESLKYGCFLMNAVIGSLYIIMLSYFIFGIVNENKKPLPKDEYPIAAVNYIKEHISNEKHIFNQYEWGSYLMFNDIPVFIDSRCDLYNKDYNRNTTVMIDYVNIVNNRQDYKYAISKYKISYFLLNKNYSLAKKILNDDEYKLIYEDGLSVIIKVIK